MTQQEAIEALADNALAFAAADTVKEKEIIAKAGVKILLDLEPWLQKLMVERMENADKRWRGMSSYIIGDGSHAAYRAFVVEQLSG